MTSPIAAGGMLKFRDLCLVGVMSAPDRPGIGAAIFRALGSEEINAQFIVQCIDLRNRSHVLFCVADEDAAETLAKIEPVATDLGAERVSVDHHTALVAIFGPDFRVRPGIAGVAFGALAEQGINILAISTSISTVSCVIQDRDCELAEQALREVFALP
jgi:aspartate kinase